MKTLRNLSLAGSILIALTLPAAAGIVVSSPANGAEVPSPFNLTMDAATCSGHTVTSVGYSLDSSSSTHAFAGQRMNGPVSAPAGWHVLHIKAWNDVGGVCVADVSIDVVGGARSVIPSNAVKVSSIQALGNWVKVHDGGTPGTSSGWTGEIGRAHV